MNVFVAADGRLRAIWRFVLGILLAFIAYSFAVGVALAVTSPRALAFDVIFRPLWVVCLLVEFSGVLVLIDGSSTPMFSMGLGRPWKRDTVVGLLIGAGMIVIASAAIAVGGDLGFRLVFTRTTWAQLIAVALVISTGAMAEELAFRGYPFQRLLSSVGRWPAVVIMAGLFGAVHLMNPHASVLGFLNTALIGALLCVAYLRSWNLWLPFGIHVGWNAMLGLVLGLPVSGVTEFSVMIRGTANGAAWLTGGSYGLEASASGTVVIILGFFALKAFVPQAQRPILNLPTMQSLGLGTPAEEIALPAPDPPDDSADLKH